MMDPARARVVLYLYPDLSCLLLLGFFAVLLPGCFLLLDFEECSSHADCYESQGTDYFCSDEHYCIYQPLVSEELGCTLPQEMELGPGTIIFGVLVTGVSEQKQDERRRSAVLAIEQINRAGALLPDHDFALLLCDPPFEEGEAYMASLAAARHIAASSRIPAVIGASSSQFTLDLFQEVFRSAGVLMISPSSTSATLSFLEDDDLLWRVAPSDLVQGAAMAEAALAWSPQRVAFLSREDAYGQGLQETFSRRYCGEGRCEEARYANRNLPQEEDADARAALLRTLSELQPDLVVAAGFIDEVVKLISDAEEAGLHPAWLLTDGSYHDSLPSMIPQAAWERVRGTRPLVEQGPAYNGFKAAYRARYEVDPADLYGPHTYDAAYILAYAVAAVGGDQASSGADIAAGLGRLSQGEPVDVGMTGWSQGISLLDRSTQASFDLQGASGGLDMSELGEPDAAVEGWVVQEDSLKSVGAIYSAQGVWLDNSSFQADL